MNRRKFIKCLGIGLGVISVPSVVLKGKPKPVKVIGMDFASHRGGGKTTFVKALRDNYGLTILDFKEIPPVPEFVLEYNKFIWKDIINSTSMPPSMFGVRK